MDLQTIKTNPDLLRERQKCSFDVKELTVLLDGGIEKYKERKERENLIIDDPDLKSPVPTEYLSHKEKYEEAVRKTCVFFQKLMDLQAEGKAGIDSYREFLGAHIGSAIFKDGNPLTLHYAMFIPTIIGQGTIEQQIEWLQRAWNLEIVGTYAQTELGHGTFIRGLETTSTYDPLTEEFVLNSPTLTSYKWWPGGLGHSANYAIVMAQLYTDGKCYGIHPFISQLRDEETHMPMPGIKIGEIGCKLGMNTTNNGYLGFENYRVPRANLLMKNNKVLKDGTYVKAPNAKLTYGTMIFVRVLLVEEAAYYLKKSLIVATRYSAVRHQSQIKEGEPEPQIIDFITQQYKLFPNIAAHFAYKYSAKWLWELYNNVTEELESGHLDRLPELHALACCLKAVSTADISLAIENCRLACGGHGYMTSSSLPATYGLVTAMCTYEGENTVLLLQTARFLVKQYESYLEGKPLTPTISYLGLLKEQHALPFKKSTEWILYALKKVAASKIQLASNRLKQCLQRGIAYEYAWNETSIELCTISETHCRAIVVDKLYHEMLALKQKVSKPLSEVLFLLVDLYAVYIALKFSGDLLRFTNITGENLNDLQTWQVDLLLAIRPNAIGLVDSFDIPDEMLSSTLGVYDGNVYEKLFEEASKSPLNAEPVNKSFHQYLKPFLQSNL